MAKKGVEDFDFSETKEEIVKGLDEVQKAIENGTKEFLKEVGPIFTAIKSTIESITVTEENGKTNISVDTGAFKDLFGDESTKNNTFDGDKSTEEKTKES